MSLLPLPRLTAGVSAILLVSTLVMMASVSEVLAENEQLFVVDQQHPDAADDNPGTADEPLTTIGKALELADAVNRQGQPTRVQVRPGIYREALQLGPSGSRTDAPFVLEGAGADRVVVDGADVWTDWEPSSHADVYEHDWPFSWGLASLPGGGWQGYFDRNDIGDVVRRREAIWVNGQLMRQVLDPAELGHGRFYVDEDASRVHLKPPAGDDLAASQVDVAVRERGLDVDRWDNVTIRGMTFRRNTTPLQQAGVRFVRVTGLLVEDVRSEWHNWTALALQDVQGATLRRTSLTRNGVQGLSVYRSEDIDIIDVENSYNNTWRGAWGGFTGWATGSKVFRARGMTFDGWHAVENVSNGLWLDTDIEDVVVRNSFMARNERRGAFIEALQGPVTLTNNVICGNLREGVLDGKSDNVTLTGNQIFDNGRAQVTFSGSSGGRSFTAYDTGEEMLIRSRNWTIQDNVLEGASGRIFGNNLNEQDWEIVHDTLAVDRNDYHHATDSRPFTLPGRIVTFDDWRAETGADTDSTFDTDTAGLACNVPPPPVPPPAPLIDGNDGPAPSPTPDPELEELSLDLDPSGTATSGYALARDDNGRNASYRWVADVTITASGGSGSPVGGVKVEAVWSSTQRVASCRSDATGRCTLVSDPLTLGRTQEQMTITRVEHPDYAVADDVLPLSVNVARP